MVLEKLIVFVAAVHSSLMKHFVRWASHKFPLCSFLSKEPTTKVVAAAMLGLPMPEFPSLFDLLTGCIDCQSKAHGQQIELKRFNSFVREQLRTISAGDEEGMSENASQAIRAAQSVLAGVNLRSCDCEEDVGEFRSFTHATCLSLPSQTLFVERGVKRQRKLPLLIGQSNTDLAWP